MPPTDLWCDATANHRPDGLLNAVPIVQCRNEERFIAQVMRPLIDVFGYALVGDTGSTDDTLPILHALRDAGQIGLYEFGLSTMAEVGRVRPRLAAEALRLGARFMWLCDADELYNAYVLRYVASQPWPTGKSLGMIAGATIEEVDGQFYELEERYLYSGRTALIRNDDAWVGEYPFEGPGDFNQSDRHHWFLLPPGWRYSHLHVHRCMRSRKDAEVPYRVQKQKQMSMINVPDVGLGLPLDITDWLAATGDADGRA